MLNVQIYTFFFNCRNLAPIFRRILNFLARGTAFCRELKGRKRREDTAGWAGCLKSRKNLCAVLIQIARRLRRSNKRRYANIRRRSGAQHCSSLCSQSEGDDFIADTPQKSEPIADLSIFATCPWPSLCEQSELQCCAATDDYAGQRKSPLRGRYRLFSNLGFLGF